jgi:hypothetical protein
MNKEELIKLLQSVEVVEVVGFSLIYYDQEKEKYSSDCRDLRTINYNYDIRQELENIRRNIDGTYDNLHREINYMIEEKLREREDR